MRRLALACLSLGLAVFFQLRGMASTNTAPKDVLLLDKLGRLVKVPTNQVPPSLLPPSGVSVERQIPEPTKGSSEPEELVARSRAAAAPFRFLPSVPPPLMPYLASQDEFGNTAVQPGALIRFFPFEPWVQGAKYRLSEVGLRYSLRQTVSFVGLTGVAQGEDFLDFYTLDFMSKWAVYSSAGGASAGWISAQIMDQAGFNSHSETQDAGRNLRTITDPTGLWCDVNGLRVPELAWQQSLRGGEIVALAGIINEGNYLDQNTYAQSGRRAFNNSALVDNQVLPLSKYNFGLNLQWQPTHEWYAMLGTSVGDTPAGQAPWSHLNLNTWSVLGEVGYAPRDSLGLGPGIYRAQPFVARAGGATQGGLGFDLQQQLGPRSPFGWFGRFAFGGEQVTKGASAQVGSGFVLHAPLKELGLVPRLSNDLLGLGFVWSQPAATTRTVYHQNEYVLETFYALQLSPTLKLMPDVQYIWDPAFNPSHDHAAVFQLQLVLAW